MNYNNDNRSSVFPDNKHHSFGISNTILDSNTRDIYKSATHGLSEALGRHRWREGKTRCSLCGVSVRM